MEANFYTVAYPYPFRVCPKQFAVLITAMITGRAATFFFSVLLGCTFLKAMLPTTSNILQALKYKHFDKILVLYISSLLPSFSLNSYSSDFKLSFNSSILKGLGIDTTVDHPPLCPLLPQKRFSVFVCLFVCFSSRFWSETALHFLYSDLKKIRVSGLLWLRDITS